MVEFEAGPPVGGLQEGLEGAGQVDEGIAHQEEPVVKWTGFRLRASY